MATKHPRWAWQRNDWPDLPFREQALADAVADVDRAIVGVTAALQRLGEPQRAAVTTRVLADDCVASLLLDDEEIGVDEARGSFAELTGSVDASPHATKRGRALAGLFIEAVSRPNGHLSLEKLQLWHKGFLGPASAGGRAAAHETPGVVRTGSLTVVGERSGRESLLFEAPPASQVTTELTEFFDWWETSRTAELVSPFVRAGLAHLWLMTLHPWSHANGRMARLVTARALAEAAPARARCFPLAIVFASERSSYRKELRAAQAGNGDPTRWLRWFLGQVAACLARTEDRARRAAARIAFWTSPATEGLQPGQRRVLERMLDADDPWPEGIRPAEYIRAAGVTKATATRHLGDLVERGLLHPPAGSTRAIRYALRLPRSATE